MSRLSGEKAVAELMRRRMRPLFVAPVRSSRDCYATDSPGIFGIPHAAVDHRAAPPHARHRPVEKSSPVATIALPRGLFLASFDVTAVV